MVRVTWRSFCVTFREQLHLVSRASGETRRCRKAVKRERRLRHEGMTVAMVLSAHHPHDVQACSAEEGGGRKVLGSTVTEDGEGSRCGGGRDHSPERFSKPMEVFDVVDSVDVSRPQVVEEVVEAAEISSERIMEHIAFQVPQERDHPRMAAWIGGYPSASDQEGDSNSFTSRTNRGAESGCPGASGQVGPT